MQDNENIPGNGSARHAHVLTTNHAYPKNTAGHRMVSLEHIPTVHEDKTIGELRNVLSQNAKRYRVMDYVYVTNSHSVLVGVLSMRDVYSAGASDSVLSVCKKSSLVTIRAEAHQERAAYLALKRNIKAVPVVDADHKLLGEISSDSVLTILDKEMHEDALRMVGISHSGGIRANVLEMPILLSIRHRIPWLFLGLLGGLLSAKVIGSFEATLEKNLVLAAFIPLIVYMSDAVGTQMESYIIRDLAILRDLPFWRYLFRHLIVVVSIGCILAALLSGSTWVLYGDIVLGLVLGISLFAAVLSSVFSGLIVPYVFSRVHMDPADASGPISTIIQDMMSIVIYFSVANALL